MKHHLDTYSRWKSTHPELYQTLFQPHASSFTAEGFHPDDQAEALRALEGHTAALHDIPKPKLEMADYWASDEEKAQHAENQKRKYEDYVNKVKEHAGLPHDTPGYEVNNHWERSMHHALSTGQLSLDEAHERGYRGDSRQEGTSEGTGWDDEGKPRHVGGWQKLPPVLHHVTTNLPGVQAHGLKSRHELGQTRGGVGLGGGSDDTISTTTDENLAHDIYQGLHEYHSVLNGHKTYDDLVNEGEAHHTPYGEKWKRENFRPGQFEADRAGMTDTKVHGSSGLATPSTEEEARAVHPDWRPHPESESMDTPRGKVHFRFHRPATEEEKINRRSDAFKSYSWSREGAGGHRNPLFMSNDPQAFARTDPKNFAILHMHPHPGAQGYPLRGDGTEHDGADSGEWRTHSGEAFDQQSMHFEQPIPNRMPGPRRVGKIAGRQESEVMRRWLADSDQLRGDDHHSRTLNQMMQQAPMVSETRHRGTLWENHQHLKPGDTFHMRPSSFTHDAETAHQFAYDAADDHDGTPLHVQVHGPHPELNPYEHYDSHSHEKESIIGGHFKVTHVQPPSEQNQWGGYEQPGQLHLQHVSDMPHTSAWRPHERMFSPGKKDLDPRLFKGDKIKQDFRKKVLTDLDRFWGPRYGSWKEWSRVYLAGGEASHWYSDHNDIDILIGVDFRKLSASHPALKGLPRSAIAQRLNNELHAGLWSKRFVYAGATWDRTFFVNPDAYDIRQIKPYAAYDLTNDSWAVRPIEAGPTWGPQNINPAVWHMVDHAIRHVRHILNDLKGFAQRSQAKEYYDYLHNDRSRAFGPYGDGLVDRGNVILKALDQHPDHLLDRLKAAARGEAKVAAEQFLPNPHEGGHTWYHGSPRNFEHFDQEEDHDDDYGDYEHDPSIHWNTHLGQHWTSVPETAEKFARGDYHHKYEQHEGGGHVFSAQLGIHNPKHFPKETQMDSEAVHHNWNYAEPHDPMEIHAEKCNNHECEGHHEHEAGDPVDNHMKRYYTQPHAAAHWLNSHPDRENLASRYGEHVRSQGHDGITYGNEIEHPIGHTAAITFNTDQIHNLQRRQLNSPRMMRESDLNNRLNTGLSFHHIGPDGKESAPPSQEEIYHRHFGQSDEMPIYEHQLRHNGNPVARLQYQVDGYEPSYLAVQAMATHKNYRGAGHATQLQLRLQQQAKQHGQTIYHGDRTPHGHAWWQSFKQHPEFDSKVHDMEEPEPRYSPEEVYKDAFPGGSKKEASQQPYPAHDDPEWDQYYSGGADLLPG